MSLFNLVILGIRVRKIRALARRNLGHVDMVSIVYAATKTSLPLHMLIPTELTLVESYVRDFGDCEFVS